MSDLQTEPKEELKESPERPMDAGSQALSEALKSSFGIVKFLLYGLLILFACSGFFQVGPNQQAVILRLGKPVGEGQAALKGSGVYASWPYPIDENIKVSVTGVQYASSTSGWYATTPAQEAAGTEPPPGGSLNPAQDGYVVTADGNIIHSRARVAFHVSDPIRFLFGFENAAKAITNAMDTALVYAAAHYNVDDILTRDIIGFREAVQRQFTALAQKQNLGITVEQCAVQSIPPRQQQVKDAFANVLKAEVTRSKVLNEAHSYENQVLSRANADAASRINQAESERVQRVNEVASRAEQFKALLPSYNANPKLFVQQRLTETLGRVFTNAQDKILVPEDADGSRFENRLMFNRELPKPKQEPAQ